MASTALYLHFTTLIPIPLTAPVADLGETEGRRAASLALPLYFTSKIPVPLTVPMANEGERGRRRAASLALPLHFTSKIPVLLTLSMADEGERGGRREALAVLCLICLEMPFPQLVPTASITVKALMLLLLLLLLGAWPLMASCHSLNGECNALMAQPIQGRNKRGATGI